MWPSRRLLDLMRVEHPIIQAPMAGAMDGELVAAVSEAGGLGCLPCAMLNAEKLREEVGKIRARTKKPIGLNFFCHAAPVPNNAREAAWRERLASYYRELGIDPAAPVLFQPRAFDEACWNVDTRPERFHFGLPPAPLYDSSSGRFSGHQLGYDGGGGALAGRARRRCDHRAGLRGRRPSGMFLTENSRAGRHARAGAAGEGRRRRAGDRGRRHRRCARHRGGFALGADGVQIGSAYLRTPEAKISSAHRAALKSRATTAPCSPT